MRYPLNTPLDTVASLWLEPSTKACYLSPCVFYLPQFRKCIFAFNHAPVNLL